MLTVAISSMIIALMCVALLLFVINHGRSIDRRIARDIENYLFMEDSPVEPQRNNYIKVNLPDSKEDYEQGNGEGVWVKVDDVVKRAYDKDVKGTTVNGTLDNDSVYYPELRAGAELLIELRGEYRPVVPHAWLQKYYR